MDPVVSPIALTCLGYAIKHWLKKDSADALDSTSLLSDTGEVFAGLGANFIFDALKSRATNAAATADFLRNQHLDVFVAEVMKALILRFAKDCEHDGIRSQLTELAKDMPEIWTHYANEGHLIIAKYQGQTLMSLIANQLASREPLGIADPEELRAFFEWIAAQSNYHHLKDSSALKYLTDDLAERLPGALADALAADHPAARPAFKKALISLQSQTLQDLAALREETKEGFSQLRSDVGGNTQALSDIQKCLVRWTAFFNQHYEALADFFGQSNDELRRLRAVVEELRQALMERSQRTGILHLSPDSAHTVPVPTKHFTGRKKELDDLHRILFGGDHTGIITGVHGLGGMGKTELAYAYARDFAAEYPGGRFIIECDQRTSLRDAAIGTASFTALFVPHISDTERMVPDSFFAAIVECLHQRIESHGAVLIVLDNVSDRALLLPDETRALSALGLGLHLLATTRLPPPAGQHTHWLQLDRLTEEDAVGLVEKYLEFKTEAERAAAHRLVKRLGCWALAVEIIAAHLHEDPEADIKGLADTIGLAEIEDPDVQRSAEAVRHHQELLLTSIMDYSLARITAEQRRVLDYAALLAPDHVPLPWLEALVTGDFPDLAVPKKTGKPWSRCWRGLVRLALLTPNDGEGDPPRLLRIHRLVQEHLQKQMGEEDRRVRQAAIEKLVNERDTTLAQTVRWQTVRWEIEPLEALAALWADGQNDGSSWLLNQVAHRWDILAEYNRAEPLMRRALAIDEIRCGEKHPKVAILLNNLAQLLQATNRLSEAEPLMRRALAIDEARFGPRHPKVATDLNNLGILLQNTNRLSEAEPLIRRALAIAETTYGPEHPELAICLRACFKIAFVS